ncbi:MAG TPA: Rieske 2Fe-2S domain-containing protein [Nitrososphaeraceae archaeon]
MMTISKTNNLGHYVFAANLKDIEEADRCCLAVQAGKNTIVLFYYNSKVYALDNRCPHMGFPLDRGTIKDGILTCHWHHARFDLINGGTFDQWAGDVTSFPVQIRNGKEVWVDISHASLDPNSYHQTLLQNGLKQNISLMIAKAVIAMLKSQDGKEQDRDIATLKAFRIGIDFGTHFKQSGWGQGLTTHVCMMNILSRLNSVEDKALALYHGLSAIAQDCASMPPRFKVSPLPLPWQELPVLKRWFRQFIESRDSQAAERCIITAVKLGATSQQLADILFAAATDHRFLDVGHTVDFTNKALEALDMVGWNDRDIVESVLSSLVLGYANAERMEESNAWRYPTDLIAILDDAFKKFPAGLENTGSIKEKEKWNSRDKLVTKLLGDDPQIIVDELLDALNQGATEVQLASSVAYAAALRIAQFHIRNEFSDWDAALHTFTFANALHQGLIRISTPELLRGVFDAAMRIYLNRFLNIPPARLPNSNSTEEKNGNDINGSGKFAELDVKTLLKELPALLDKQQQINQAGQLVAGYLYNLGNSELLLDTLGNLLLREDRNFHSIQMTEAAFRQYSIISCERDIVNSQRTNILIAAARYLAAHSPTTRSQGRTYQIATQLHHGEELFEE